MIKVHKSGRIQYCDLWFGKGKMKNFTILNYKKPWQENGNPPVWGIRTNGGRRRKGDNCFDLNINLGYIIIIYTNFDLQRRAK